MAVKKSDSKNRYFLNNLIAKGFFKNISTRMHYLIAFFFLSSPLNTSQCFPKQNKTKRTRKKKSWNVSCFSQYKYSTQQTFRFCTSVICDVMRRLLGKKTFFCSSLTIKRVTSKLRKTITERSGGKRKRESEMESDHWHRVIEPKSCKLCSKTALIKKNYNNTKYSHTYKHTHTQIQLWENIPSDKLNVSKAATFSSRTDL